MKFLALFALMAVAACRATDEKPAVQPQLYELFVGELQYPTNGEMSTYGDFSLDDSLPLSTVVPLGIPSCKLGEKIGNPICFAKCVSRGHRGGYCKGKVCTCV